MGSRRHSKVSPEARQEKLDQAHQRLVDAVANLATSEDWIAYLMAMSRFHSYSPANIFMIVSQRPSASMVGGFRTWKAMGRQVRKGAKGIAIWAPVVHRTKTEDVETGEVEVLRRRSGFKICWVFDVADTDGAPLPEAPARAKLLEGEAPEGMWDFLAAQVAEAGYRLELHPEVPGRSTANGQTDFLARTVVVATSGRSDASRTRTLAHELAHIRLEHQTGRVDAAVAEVEAESVAFLISDAWGLDASGWSLGYVSGWAAGNADQVLATAKAVQRCAAEILAPLDQTPEAEGGGVQLEEVA